jgi:hypoxanthine phosphoribosyltransferase
LAVPSSGPKMQSGIRMLAKQIANSFNCRVLSGLLQRRYEVAKKSTGGRRDLYSDMDSLNLIQPKRLNGKKILLMDDVITSGTTMKACENVILNDAKPYAIIRLSIGVTKKKITYLDPFHPPAESKIQTTF